VYSIKIYTPNTPNDGLIMFELELPDGLNPIEVSTHAMMNTVLLYNLGCVPDGCLESWHTFSTPVCTLPKL
jgi:hypothetical protein